jgi:hypothetical protein
MAFMVAQLFTAIEQKNTGALWDMFQNMTVPEMVAAGTAIGPERLREMLYRFVGRSDLRAANRSGAPGLLSLPQEDDGADMPRTVIPEILVQAFNDRQFKLPQQDADIALQVKKSLLDIYGRRKGSPQILLNRDVTKTLPQQTICPAPLSDLNFQEVADRNGITVASIKAVAKVESGGGEADSTTLIGPRYFLRRITLANLRSICSTTRIPICQQKRATPQSTTTAGINMAVFLRP